MLQPCCNHAAHHMTPCQRLALRAQIETQLTRKPICHLFANLPTTLLLIYRTSFACPWLRHGGCHFGPFGPTSYYNDIDIKNNALDFWYFEAVRFAARIFLHQSTPSYFLVLVFISFNFGTSSYSIILSQVFFFLKYNTIKHNVQ